MDNRKKFMVDGHRSAQIFIITSLYEGKSRKWMMERLLANGLTKTQAQNALYRAMYVIKTRKLRTKETLYNVPSNSSL